MNREQEHFYVTLFSNSSQSLFVDNTIAAFTIHLAEPVELGSTDNWAVGLCEPPCPLQYASGTYGGVTIVGDTNILIYCNLISPQFVGGELVRCLRTFITPSLHCQHIFEIVYYLPVEKRSFQDIRIQLLMMDGKRHSFKECQTPLKVVLYFRRVSA
jgi:hypothetical protein